MSLSNQFLQFSSFLLSSFYNHFPRTSIWGSVRCRHAPNLTNYMIQVIPYIALSTTAFVVLQIIKRVASWATQGFLFVLIYREVVFFCLRDCTKVMRWPKRAPINNVPAGRDNAGESLNMAPLWYKWTSQTPLRGCVMWLLFPWKKVSQLNVLVHTYR